MAGNRTDADAGPVQVFYDGGCPVCSREIAFYQARPDADRFVWVDINGAPDTILGPDLDREAALARMHVRLADGRLVTGAAAFAAMWRRMPGFRWLGRLLAVPPIGWGAERAYRLFLVLRPVWRPAARP
jgi:predicted DCC family thiol-disulfide oxidoreductase YuxK